jgi:DNA-binding XRE family transcriptional regulator
MRKLRENIYRSSRDYAGLTRVAAALALSIGERTLANYEAEQVPPDEIVLAMARLYQAPWLRVQHLVENSLVFQDIFKIQKIPESEGVAIISVSREASDLPAAVAGLMDAACGRAAKAAGHVKELLDVAVAAIGLLGVPKAKAACAGTQTTFRESAPPMRGTHFV